MALTKFQQTVCHVIAANRLEQGESYVPGDIALSYLLDVPRLSRDIDLFHDTVEALQTTWQADRDLLLKRSYEVQIIHERPAYVEALVSKDGEAVLLQWTQDSAYRFFPLVQHEQFGLVLHPFDLATNKVLALIGRLEVRDWIDLIACSDRVQPLGYLAWAACGKDPAFSPLSILEHAQRSGRYTVAELAGLSFDGPPPDLAATSRAWHALLQDAAAIIAMLPPEHAGKCVLRQDGSLYGGNADELKEDLASNVLLYHSGSIRGAYPQIIG